MKKNDILSYVYDFISQISENAVIFDELKSIILFGSVARGDFDKDSDIDLFIDINGDKSENKIHEEIKKELRLFEIRCEKSWHMRGIRFPLKILVGNIQNSRWESLKKEIESYGLVLYGELRNSAFLLRHHALISFETARLHQNQKMTLLRELYGYSTTKEKKVYTTQGIVEEFNGTKVGTNVLLIPFDHVSEMRTFFRKHKTSCAIKSFWER
ncbi:nucleotidyltransferase domain-containing protein [Candidatus Woesearchaeota archaeon]|nr:nucleotidyltransferase domain-containing protein [Candidatus Woesearchaeota archaeon]